ncbi:MAG: hypothetical protein EAZ91_22460 [Cytophagales bacterium]|nr:MAG: hypothetical protein EAZ91_22460 [Cytophagales bacterium]
MKTFSQFPCNGQPAYTQLMKYLTLVRDYNADAIGKVGTIDIVTDTYKEFYNYLNELVPREQWMPFLLTYCKDLCKQLGRKEVEVDIALRTVEFAVIAQRVHEGRLVGGWWGYEGASGKGRNTALRMDKGQQG